MRTKTFGPPQSATNFRAKVNRGAGGLELKQKILLWDIPSSSPGHGSSFSETAPPLTTNIAH